MNDISEHIFDQFSRLCLKHNLICAGDCIIVAVSGGADSTAALDLTRRFCLEHSGIRLRAAHYNHKLRPEADAEADYVADLCRKLGVELVCKERSAKDDIARSRDGLHAAGRRMRYRFLIAAAREFKTSVPECPVVKIVLGHQQDDQLETVLMRLLQGCGVGGLSGMLPVAPCPGAADIMLVRPALDFRRSELVEYCRARGLKFVEDASNLDERYPRTRIRQKLLPQIERLFGAAARVGILRSAELFRQTASEIERQMQNSWLKTLKSSWPGTISLDFARYNSYNSIIRLGILQTAARQVWRSAEYEGSPRLSYVHCRTADEAIRRGFKGICQLGERLAIQLWRDAVYLFIEYNPAWEFSLAAGCAVEIPFVGRLETIILPSEQCILPPPLGMLFINADIVNAGRFIVRSARPGDRLKPLGLPHYCSAFDLWRDMAVPPHRRKSMPVVEADGEIAALPPFRISNDFRITTATRRGLALRLIPAVVDIVMPSS
ncbi:MAG: tRNA lysidine(34) synthetase TilS [Calditrichaeota bacterium]|nr:tRNA lysidine(34) synthetase TilS [Calditrichota bacterium]